MERRPFIPVNLVSIQSFLWPMKYRIVNVRIHICVYCVWRQVGSYACFYSTATVTLAGFDLWWVYGLLPSHLTITHYISSLPYRVPSLLLVISISVCFRRSVLSHVWNTKINVFQVFVRFELMLQSPVLSPTRIPSVVSTAIITLTENLLLYSSSLNLPHVSPQDPWSLQGKDLEACEMYQHKSLWSFSTDIRTHYVTRPIRDIVLFCKWFFFYTIRRDWFPLDPSLFFLLIFKKF